MGVFRLFLTAVSVFCSMELKAADSQTPPIQDARVMAVDPDPETVQIDKLTAASSDFLKGALSTGAIGIYGSPLSPASAALSATAAAAKKANESQNNTTTVTVAPVNPKTAKTAIENIAPRASKQLISKMVEEVVKTGKFSIPRSKDNKSLSSIKANVDLNGNVRMTGTDENQKEKVILNNELGRYISDDTSFYDNLKSLYQNQSSTTPTLQNTQFDSPSYQSKSLSSNNAAAHTNSTKKQSDSTTEALAAESSLANAQNKIKEEINTATKTFGTTPLHSEARTEAVNGLISSARDSISMPVGASNLTTNPLYGKILPDSNNYSVDSSLSSLIKKDLSGNDLKSNFGDIRDIAASESFQLNAAKLIGNQKLTQFNLAALGAEILLEAGSTTSQLLGINKSLGSPYSDSIAKFNLNIPTKALAAAAYNANGGSGFLEIEKFSMYEAQDWIEVARNLTDSKKIMLKPLNFDNEKAQTGRQLLELLLSDLKSFNSSDLLNAVTVPMDNFIVTWTKEAHDRIIQSLGKIRTISTTEIVEGENLNHIEKFKAEASTLQKDLLETKVMAFFYDKFFQFYYDVGHQALWKEYSPKNFEEAKRSLGIIRFSLALNGLRKKNYKEIPDESLPYLISQSFKVLDTQRAEKQKDPSKEKIPTNLRLADSKKLEPIKLKGD